MRSTRREFLAAAGTASAMALAGCDGRVRDFFRPGPPNDDGPFLAPETSEIDLTSHLINRLTYGPRPGDYARVRALGTGAFIEEQLAPESLDDGACERITRRLETLAAPTGELFEYKRVVLQRELTKNVALRGLYSRRQLYEQMVGFWTDHFNIDISKGDCPWLKAADDRDVIRKHAMGSFPDLVRASALSPAMLWYLDGRANRAGSAGERPNENYARELLELHTLGVHGGYTQQDVMEVARCLSGWTVRSEMWFGNGRVEFLAEHHDDGEKVVLGERIEAGLGEKDFDRVLDIVARHPSTGLYIAAKLCKRFISDVPDQAAVLAVAEAFQTSSGDIRATLRTLFQTPAFVAARGAKFKQPFRFILSALRASGSEADPDLPTYEVLQRMGHVPFEYPTPDGYPEEAEHWAGTMLWRWHYALALFENRVEDVRTDWTRLTTQFGDARNAMAHALSRKPSDLEASIFQASPLAPALVLASPAFQRY